MVADALSRKMISTLSLNHYDWRFESNGALLTQVRVIPNLKMMIRDAQKNDVKLKEVVQLVRNGDKTDYFIDENEG